MTGSVYQTFVKSWTEEMEGSRRGWEKSPGDEWIRVRLGELPASSPHPAAFDPKEAWLVIDWLVRVATPAFLRREPHLEGDALRLEELREIKRPRRVARALEPLESAARHAERGARKVKSGERPPEEAAFASDASHVAGIAAALHALHALYGPRGEPRGTGMPQNVHLALEHVGRASEAAAAAAARTATQGVPAPLTPLFRRYDALAAEYHLDEEDPDKVAARHQAWDAYYSTCRKVSWEALRDAVDEVQRSALVLLQRLSAAGSR